MNMQLGLSLVACDSEGELPGHVIIPEINAASRDDPQRRLRVKEWCKDLAELASQDVISGFSDVR
jgi:hypothetical protein